MLRRLVPFLIFAITLLVVAMLILALSGCAPPMENTTTSETNADIHYILNSGFTRVFRVIDKEAGVVCYMFGETGIDCFLLDQTKLWR